MNLKIMNISQMAEVTGHDRATIAKCLKDLKPLRNSQNLKTYYSIIAIPLIMEKTKSYAPRWSEIVTSFVNQLETNDEN
jgi:hypothetical protein